MDRQSLLQRSARSHMNDFIENTGRDKPIDGRILIESIKEPFRTIPTSAPEKIAENVAERNSGSSIRFLPWPNALAQTPTMTIAEFVERKFVPERVARMQYSGRTHYQAMLKHILTPEEVDRVFQRGNGESKGKLKAIPGWPYLDRVPLNEVRPEYIERLTAAAVEKGYSSQTVAHIRNVVAAIFSHAQKEQCFAGANPASQVKLSKVTSQKRGALSFAQAREVIRAMRSPERELALLAISTDMNMAEICGLQWKHVNLTGETIWADGERIPQRSIAVRKQWYRGSLGPAQAGRMRVLPISESLFQLLVELKDRGRYTASEDFVLISRSGTPVNQTNIAARRLKPIAERLNVPSLCWQTFRRTRKALVSEFGMKFDTFVTMVLAPAFPHDPAAPPQWHCRSRWPRVPSSL